MKPLLSALLFTAASATLAQVATPPGAMLRQGAWGGDVGFGLPPVLSSRSTAGWPMRNWALLRVDEGSATLTMLPLTPETAAQTLQPIRDQVAQAQSRSPGDQVSTNPNEPPSGTENDLYVWIPGLAWKAQTVPLYRFRNGTPGLGLEVGHQYELTHAGEAFTFMVQNGLRTADGRPYGQGAQFSLQVDGQRYDYELGGDGWDVRIEALGDFDGDGKPDFLFAIGDSNSVHEALVLSSQARPGRNPPTAYLTASGC